MWKGSCARSTEDYTFLLGGPGAPVRSQQITNARVWFFLGLTPNLPVSPPAGMFYPQPPPGPGLSVGLSTPAKGHPGAASRSCPRWCVSLLIKTCPLSSPHLSQTPNFNRLRESSVMWSWATSPGCHPKTASASKSLQLLRQGTASSTPTWSLASGMLGLANEMWRDLVLGSF